MAYAKKKRVTSVTIRESAKRDNSPSWEGSASWSEEKMAQAFRTAMSYYNQKLSSKDWKPTVLAWMVKINCKAATITAFRAVKDDRSSPTMAAVAAALMRGMPVSHKNLNNGRNSADWLRDEILKAITEGKADVVIQEKKKEQAVVVTIQDRIREQAIEMSNEIDSEIDSYLMNPEKFNADEFKILPHLRSKGAKAAQARHIKSFFQYGHDELVELASGKADEQLREAYSKHPRKNIKKLIAFYQNIMSACDQIAAESKIMKKTRAKKVKPAEELVKNLKFKKSDDKLGIVSVPPAQIIGAQGMVIYLVKTRKIGYYIAKTSEGLSVKGTSILNFTEKSIQKTIRKPIEALKEFKELNTQKRFETWFEKNVKTTDTRLTGRFSEDIIILKVWK